MVGAKKEVESLDVSLAPRLGVGGKVKVIPVAPDIKLNVMPGPVEGLPPPDAPNVTQPDKAAKPEWPGEGTEETTPDEGHAGTNKILSVDLQDLPEVCAKEDCEGEMIVMATGDKLGCKKCGAQIDSPERE